MTTEHSPAPRGTFHAADAGRVAYFVDFRATKLRHPVVGYFDHEGDVRAAILVESTGAVVPYTEAGTAYALAAVVEADSAPSQRDIDRAHQRAVEPIANATWLRFHNRHGHDACGHHEPDGWWDDKPADASWGPGADTELAAKVRAELAQQYRIDPGYVGCPHEYVECSPEFCGRTNDGATPA